MTKEEIRTFVGGIDPDAKHYFTALDGESYTVWMETNRTGLEADNTLKELGWDFDIVRYTQNEHDPMPDKIEKALLEDDMIGYEYYVEVRPEIGYILHHFTCSV